MIPLAYFFLAVVGLGADTPGETAYVHPAMLSGPAVELSPVIDDQPGPPTAEPPDFAESGRIAASRRVEALLRSEDAFTASGPPASAPFLTERERTAAAVVERMSRAGLPEQQLLALEAGGGSGASEVLKILTALQGDTAGRRRAERALEAMEPTDLAAAILDLLAITPEMQRSQVLTMLPGLSAAQQAPFLDILRNEDPASARAQYAAQCLGQTAAVAAVPLLAERAWSGDPAVSYSYAYALWLSRAPSALPEWHRLLGHGEPAVRALAQEALLTMGGEREVSALYDAATGVTEADVNLQVRAAQWLGTLNEPFVIPMLVEAMERNQYIREAVGQILRQKTGAEVGNTPQAWRAWMKTVTQMNTPQLVPAQENSTPQE